MVKILSVSNHGVSDGYGRISDSVCTGLHKRNYQILAASFAYDGLLPASYDGVQLPYHVASMAGKPNWVEIVCQLVETFNPDVILVTQDMPFAEAIRYSPIDWSKRGLIIISPVDGSPILPRWVDVMQSADARLTISQFGVEAYRKQGVEVGLCRPAANLDKFYRLSDTERAALREKAGIAHDAFVLGTAAQNQGRKAIDAMLRGFMRFAQDKPTARYILDMDKQSPVGWDIPAMCQQFGWDVSKLIFREELFQRGVHELRERYALMDAHAVLSHREGFGLPLHESQCCGVATMALDWCSGTEIVGDGKGVLVKPVQAYDEPVTIVSTWGNALDYMPDDRDFTTQLQFLYDNPHERLATAERGMNAARKWNWDLATDVVQSAIETTMAKRRAMLPAQ